MEQEDYERLSDQLWEYRAEIAEEQEMRHRQKMIAIYGEDYYDYDEEEEEENGDE